LPVIESNRFELYERVAREEALTSGPITYLEFGVAEGVSFRWWANANTNSESRFVGFDTFTGLPEAWGGLGAGTFSTGGAAPNVEDSRCSFEKGLVQDTLAKFLARKSESHRKVIHCDLDLYAGTLFVLMYLYPHLREGDIIFFDEFGSYLDEFRAYRHFLQACPIELELLWGTNNYWQAAFKVRRPFRE
jgi:hypothetical protein